MKRYKRDKFTIVGVLIILLWVSHLPYLLYIPIQSTQATRDYAKYIANSPIKEITGLDGMNEDEIDKIIVRGSRGEFIKALFLYSFGILSGILVLTKRNWGRYVAIIFFSYIFSLRFYSLIKGGHIWEQLYAKYTIFFPKHQLRVIHMDWMTWIIGIIAILYLIRSHSDPSGSRK